MAIHMLSENRTLQSLIDNDGLASGDTVNLNGFELACGTDCVSYPVTITGSGKFEARNGGRIKLNASISSSCFIYVDPTNPLPESNYEAGFNANASFEFQLNGSFALGGAGANMPTATRAGNFWALATSYPSTTQVVLDRHIPLHPGDILKSLNFYDNQPVAEVESYDEQTNTVTFVSAPSRRLVGDQWGLCSGGVAIVITSGSGYGIISSSMSVGTLTVMGNAVTLITSTTVGLLAKRLGYAPSGTMGQSIFLISSGTIVVDQCVAPWLFSPTGATGSAFCKIGEVVSTQIFTRTSTPTVGRYFIGGGRVYTSNGYENQFPGKVDLRIENLSFTGGAPGVPNGLSSVTYKNATINGSFTGFDEKTVLSSGTVNRTARTEFPTDTDLPDAQYHAPKAAAAVTWRYEDRWVRKGETLRIRARWMPAGTASMASVAVTSIATWWPDFCAVGAEALAKAEFPAGLEQLRWHDGSVEWRNDTGEDCQVRVWECVTGDTLGGYLRIWQATGGAM